MKYPYLAKTKHCKSEIVVVGEFSETQEYCVYLENPKEVVVLNKIFIVKND